MSRSEAREMAFKYVYTISFGQEEKDQVTDTVINSSEDKKIVLGENDKKFFDELTDGALTNIEKIDEIVFSKLKNWTKDRIFKIDLAILRLSIFELMYTETPYKVIVNEAVELAKKYGNDESYTFVNGVLREVIKDKGV